MSLSKIVPFLIFALPLAADEIDAGLYETGIIEPFAKKTLHSVEFFVSYEYYSHIPFNSVATANLTYYHQVEKYQANTYLGISGLTHDGDQSFLFKAGAYKDWSDRFYTFSALSAGTHSQFYPKLNIDQQFYFKLREKRDLIPSVGFKFVQTFDTQRTWTFDAGLSYYVKNWILTYQFFENYRTPGDHFAPTHLVSIGYGKHGENTSFLTTTFGHDIYTLLVPTLEEVHNQFFRTALNHRHWLTQGWGIYGEAAYTRIFDSHTVYGAYLGFFKEF